MRGQIAGVLALMVLSTSAGHAQRACADALVPTREESVRDSRNWLSYALVISRSKYEELKHSAGAAVGIPVLDAIIKVSADYDDYSKRVEQAAQLEQLRIDQRQASSNLRTHLSSESLRAWAECMRSQGGVLLYGGSVSDLGFATTVEWAPPPGVAAGTLDLLVMGGRLVLKAGRFELGDVRLATVHSEHWKTRYQRSFLVQRQKGQTTTLVANIGGFTDTLLVGPLRDPPVFSWANWLAGKWCGPPGTSWTWAIDVEEPRIVHTSADGESPGLRWEISAAGPSQVRFRSTTNPDEVIVYRRANNDRLELLSPRSPGYRPGPFERCP